MTKFFDNFADLASFIATETEIMTAARHMNAPFSNMTSAPNCPRLKTRLRWRRPIPTASRCRRMVMATLFDVFRDTRLEPFTADLAWGFVNSFHVVAKRINDREDDAAKELGDLARS